MKYLNDILFIFVLLTYDVMGQQSHLSGQEITLEEIFQLAANSITAKTLDYSFYESYLEYENTRKDILPQISLTGVLPQINKTFTQTTLADGKEVFVSQFFGNQSGSFNLTQSIPYTNTHISISSGLQQLVLYGKESERSFLSTPFNVTITQSFFVYNAEKWKRKINPIKYEVAKQQYLCNRESIFIRVLELYFELLLAQEQYKKTLKDCMYYDSLCLIAKEKFDKRNIIEAEYLHIELMSFQAKYDKKIHYQVWINALTKLQNFLSQEKNIWILHIPDINFIPRVPIDKAKNEALQNNPLFFENHQREIEAQSILVRAKSENRFRIDIQAAFSLSQTAENIKNAYSHLKPQEYVSLGFNIPLLDWGKSKRNINIAKTKKEKILLEIINKNQEFEYELERDVYSLINQKEKVNLSFYACKIAAKRLEIEKLRYILSKSSFQNLHDAMRDRDILEHRYIEDLKECWLTYYLIRQRTLFDFTKGCKIEFRVEDILNKCRM